MPRYLVVANQTLGGEKLAEEIRHRIAQGVSSFYVLVPHVPVEDAGVGVGLGDADTGVSPDVLAGLPARQADAERRADQESQKRLEQLLEAIRAAGADAAGDVGASDPVAAVEESLTEGPFDEIIVSTLPAGVSRWLRMDVPSRIERRFKLPVTTVTAQS